MQFSRFVRMLGLLLVLSLPGFGGGCGKEPTPMASEDAEKLRASRSKFHKEQKAEQKAVAKKIEEQRESQAAKRKGGHRGGGMR